MQGTTSACAENTYAGGHCVEHPGNYLRVRGEYSGGELAAEAVLELPPRARRILNRRRRPAGTVGTTSACAENTRPQRKPPVGVGNYLRVRGEYRRWNSRFRRSMELPPRARRILINQAMVSIIIGTTSACAENTLKYASLVFLQWNYLRVRGEYPAKSFTGPANSELPPRARRIRVWRHRQKGVPGTTSACAENTFVEMGGQRGNGNYLRVRGEY